MEQRILTAQSALLALATFGGSASQLEGLNRRFPEAWSNRQNYPYYKHRIFKSISLADEYVKNLAYCLWEHSLQDLSLRTEMRAMLIRVESSTYKHYKKGKGAIIDEGYYKNFCEYILGSDTNIRIMVSFCVADFFINLCDLNYDESYRDKMYDEWDVRIREFLKDSQPKNLWGLRFLEIEDKMENPAEVRLIQSYSKAYAEHLGCSIQDYLNKTFFQPKEVHETISAELAFSTPLILGMQIIEFTNGGLTQTEAINILGQLTGLYARHQGRAIRNSSINYLKDVMEGKIELTEEVKQRVKEISPNETYELPEVLTPDLIEFYDQYLPIFCAYYLLARHHEENRDYFFKIKTNADTISLASMEKELTRTKKELKEFKHQAKSHQSELSKVKTESQRQFQERLKRSQEELILSNQQVKRLTQDKESLSEEIERLKESLAILTNQVEMQESIDLKEASSDSSFAKVDLNQSKILIMGGHPHVVAKLKEKLPNCKFCECRRLYQDDFFKNVEYAYIFVEWLNHGMTGKLNKIRPDIPKRVIAATNPDRILSEMEAAYLKDLSLNQVEA